MELKYPNKQCSESPTGAHFFTILTGKIWRCKYCWVAMYLPTYWTDADNYGYDIHRMGIEKAYQKLIQNRPKVREMLVKLEEIRLLRKVMTEKELIVAIAAIITGKEVREVDEYNPEPVKELLEPNPQSIAIDHGTIAKPSRILEKDSFRKGGAWVDKSLPTPDGIVMADKRGVQYRVQSGRKITGEWRSCIDCGKPIYVRTHRLTNPNFGKRCAPCNKKAYPPPRKRRRLSYVGSRDSKTWRPKGAEAA